HDVILPAVRASLGSARVSRAGERVPRSRTSLKETQSHASGELFESLIRRDAETNTRDAGVTQIAAAYEVDQTPIGRTWRSTPGTYVKVFDEIRNLYAQLPVSRMRGYSASRFSFNAEGGRCETCKGQGVIKLEMNFLPSSYVPCEECHGRR